MEEADGEAELVGDLPDVLEGVGLVVVVLQEVEHTLACVGNTHGRGGEIQFSRQRKSKYHSGGKSVGLVKKPFLPRSSKPMHWWPW